jgi:hypothetical protein
MKAYLAQLRGTQHPGQPSLIKAATGDLALRRHIKTPEIHVSAHFRLADKSSYLNAIYYFDPEAEAIRTPPVSSWGESDWHREYIQTYPEKVAYIERLRHWADAWMVQLRSAFNSKALGK